MTVKPILSKLDVFPPAEIQAQTCNVLIAEVLTERSCFRGEKSMMNNFYHISLKLLVFKEYVKEASYALQGMRAGFYPSVLER